MIRQAGLRLHSSRLARDGGKNLPLGDRQSVHAHERRRSRISVENSENNLNLLPSIRIREMVGTGGLEPPTPCASSKCSPPELRAFLSHVQWRIVFICILFVKIKLRQAAEKGPSAALLLTSRRCGVKCYASTSWFARLASGPF